MTLRDIKEVVIMLMPMVWNDFDVVDPFTEMDNLFNTVFTNTLEPTKAMRTDVTEEDKDYKLEAELPGFNKEDIGVDLKDGVLTIHAAHKENKDQKDEKSGKYIRRERSEASYQRSFTVGEDVKPEDITAKYENGVLTLTIPKKEEAIEQKEEPKKIEIK